MNRMTYPSGWIPTGEACSAPVFPREQGVTELYRDSLHYEGGLEGLKNRLLNEVLARNVSTALVAPLRRAAEEAASLAWLESYPLLVFPALFAEKALETRLHEQRQNLIRSRSAEIYQASV